jgi:F-type H+-transporting ATPase subunit b
MTIDATFWVAISFFIFFGGLVYLKIPQKINNSLVQEIDKMKKELEEAEKLKVQSKNLLSNYENNIDKSKKEIDEIISFAKKENEKNILKKTKKFHEIIENKKKSTEQKIFQMRENALRDIKNSSVLISIETVKRVIQNSIDKNKLEKIYIDSLEQTKNSLKNIKI